MKPALTRRVHPREGEKSSLAGLDIPPDIRDPHPQKAISILDAIPGPGDSLRSPPRSQVGRAAVSAAGASQPPFVSAGRYTRTARSSVQRGAGNVKRHRDLGRAMRHLRGARTQAEVSEAAGIDAGIWSQYECGHRTPKEANLVRIVQGLGCGRLEFETVRWQFRRQELAAVEDPQAPAEPPAAAPEDPVREQIHALASRLSEVFAEALLLNARTRHDSTGDGSP